MTDTNGNVHRVCRICARTYNEAWLAAERGSAGAAVNARSSHNMGPTDTAWRNVGDVAGKAPILASLMAVGVVWFDGTEVVGRAADGVEVNLGDTGDLADVERYLVDHPTPRDW